jgi:hypothetical protein
MLQKGNSRYAKPSYIPEADANGLGKLIGGTDQNRAVLATIVLGHMAALDPEEGIIAASVVAHGATQKQGGTVEVTAWNLLPPGAAATDPPIMVKDEASFKKLMDVGYLFHSESTAKVQVGVQ